MHPTGRSSSIRTICLVLLTACAACVSSGCSKATDTTTEGQNRTFLTVNVGRETVALKVTATGVIRPITEIEIKSKASGKIIRMPVETGQVVQPGALLAQVDTSELAADLRQRVAQVEVQRALYARAERMKTRSDDLLRQGLISADDHEQAALDYAQARAQLVMQEAELAKARERMEETIVRAPCRGTILERKVALGQVITSGASSYGEGTTLMKMADLSTMQVRMLVDEADIGKVRPGLEATVKVDAYPERSFTARIGKIEPVSEEQQNVTFFPVLISIDNREGLLMPGMRCSVEINIIKKDNVLAVSGDALVSIADAPGTGMLLDIPEDTMRAILIRAGIDSTQLPPKSTGSSMMTGPSGPPPTPVLDRAVLFTTNSMGFRPVVVKTGVRDWRMTELVQGAIEGMQVIIPPSAMLAQQFARVREMVAKYSGLPGKKTKK